MVWSEVEKFLLDKTMAKELLNEAYELWVETLRESPEEKIKKKISTKKLQDAAFAERISLLPSNFDATPLLTQIGKLQSMKSDLEKKLSDSVNISEVQEEPISLRTLTYLE